MADENKGMLADLQAWLGVFPTDLTKHMDKMQEHLANVDNCSLWSTATPIGTRRTPMPQLWPRQSWSVTLRPRTLRRIPAMEAMDYN